MGLYGDCIGNDYRGLLSLAVACEHYKACMADRSFYAN
jgi:hypothetical protein